MRWRPWITTVGLGIFFTIGIVSFHAFVPYFGVVLFLFLLLQRRMMRGWRLSLSFVVDLFFFYPLGVTLLLLSIGDYCLEKGTKMFWKRPWEYREGR